jgi:hypothetical protein
MTKALFDQLVADHDYNYTSDGLDDYLGFIEAEMMNTITMCVE